MRPVAEAGWETYRPFEDLKELWRRGGDRDLVPYRELAALSLKSPEEIEEWCSRWGLLGILPHRTLKAYLWPRWEREGEVATGFGAEPDPEEIWAVQDRFVNLRRRVNELVPLKQLPQRSDRIPGASVDDGELAVLQDSSAFRNPTLDPLVVEITTPEAEREEHVDLFEG
ncbi:MAG: hypothetical protein ACRD3V_18230, partial [Vicinamibacteria bacterium]